MPRVAIVSFPWASYVPYKFLSDVLRILEPICEKIVLIVGNTDRIDINSDKIEVRDINVSVHYLSDIKPRFYSALLWIVKCTKIQIKESLELIREKKNIDIVLFYMAYPYYLLPLITSRILGKKNIEVVTRSRSNSLFSKIVGMQDPILFNLLDGISVEVRTLAGELKLKKYNRKLLPEGARFIDITRYTPRKRLSERENVVGFIGRLRKEKGVVEFVRAIPLVVRDNENVKFLIAGSGDLLDWIWNECKRIEDKFHVQIELPGFIEEEELPNCMNELKLLVLPTTHAEGLPTLVLEAMACGTPVLVTSVGGLPELVRDGETGFIMKTNSPACIAENVIRALNHPKLEQISYNARNLVEERFTYEKAVDRWKKIIDAMVYPNE